MANTYFQFKEFRVNQPNAAMKVGVDSVILGSWLKLDCPRSVLDIGTGTGLLALMMAQRNIQSQVVAVEIDDKAIVDARHNFQESIFASRLDLVHASIQEFAMLTDRRFDLIVSNPPYFDAGNRSVNEARSTARHHDSLSLDELFETAEMLLTPTGSFALILPYDIKEKALAHAQNNTLFLTAALAIYPTPDKQPNRVVLQFKKESKECENEKLLVRINGNYSPEYTQLTSGFYL